MEEFSPGPSESSAKIRRRVELKCARCGRSFERVPSRAARSRFCSKACAYPPRPPHLCEGCGRSFFPKPSEVGRFCSVACSRRRAERHCAQCGAAFIVRPCEAAQRFCSRACDQAARAARFAAPRICPDCGLEKQAADFIRKDGGRRVYCALCYRVRNREAARAQRQAIKEATAAGKQPWEIRPDQWQVVFCRDCKAQWHKWKDALNQWEGRCVSCARRVVAARPEERIRRRQQCGPRGSNWQGGVTPKHECLRRSADYAAWRKAVFERDQFTCALCGQRGGRLNADHIVPFARDESRRLDVSNGRTLCEQCHRVRHSKPR